VKVEWIATRRIANNSPPLQWRAFDSSAQLTTLVEQHVATADTANSVDQVNHKNQEITCKLNQELLTLYKG